MRRRSFLGRVWANVPPLLLAACASDGGSGGATTNSTPPPTSGYSIGAPAAATVGNNPPTTAAGGFHQATPGGPTFTGSGAGLASPGSVFALTQTAYQFPASGGAADTQTMAAGSTATVVDLNNGMWRLTIPNLSIDVVVKADSFTTSSLGGAKNLLFGLNGNGASGTVLANLKYTALGSWVVLNASTGLATNMANFVAGYQTLVASVPTSGTATYSGIGTVKGSVLIPGGMTGAQLTGDSALTANFATGAITGSFTNMSAMPVSGGAATPWNSVSVTASISGATFSGQTSTSSTPSSIYALGAATGPIKGGFYGPNADEVGAVWTLYDGAKAAFGGVASPKVP